MCQSPSREAALFVHVSWRTISRKPLLTNDEIRQAVHQAITTRTRSHFCRVLAIGGSDCEMHVIFHFPASLQVSCLAKMSMQASAEAVAQLFQTLYAQRIHADAIWERQYGSQTLNAADVADANAYLQRQMTAAEVQEETT